MLWFRGCLFEILGFTQNSAANIMNKSHCICCRWNALRIKHGIFHRYLHRNVTFRKKLICANQLARKKITRSDHELSFPYRDISFLFAFAGCFCNTMKIRHTFYFVFGFTVTNAVHYIANGQIYREHVLICISNEFCHIMLWGDIHASNRGKRTPTKL